MRIEGRPIDRPGVALTHTRSIMPAFAGMTDREGSSENETP